MPRPNRQGGQASVELIALIPAFLLVGVIAWQILATAQSWLNATGAARAGARAAAVGDPARDAAGRVIRLDGPRGGRVTELSEGEHGPRVQVRVRAPYAIPRSDIGWITVAAEAAR